MSATRKKLRTVGVNEHGRRIGEWHHASVLSDSEIEMLRDLRENEGWSTRRLATTFGLSRWAVRNICSYKTRAQTAVRFKKA